MKMIQKNRGRLFQEPNLLIRVTGTLAVLVTALVITACGGGGGGGSTPPASVTQTVTCPNGTSKTGTGATVSAALDVATAQCAVPLLVSITPADKSVVAPPTVVATTTDSTLDTSSLTTANVTLKAGTQSVAGTVSADGNKGFKFTPSVKLMYAQVYSFIANVKDTLGKSLAVSSTFTTASISCTAPLVPDSAGTTCVPPVCPAGTTWSGTSCEVPPAQTCTAPSVWTTGINACVTPIGTLVVGANFLPPECVTIGDSCWMASVANNTIKFVNSGAVQTGYNTRPIVFAFYKGKLSDGTTLYNVVSMFADVPGTSTAANKSVQNGGSTDIISEIKGSVNGAKQTSSVGCYERVFSGSGWVNNGISCPI